MFDYFMDEKKINDQLIGELDEDLQKKVETR